MLERSRQKCRVNKCFSLRGSSPRPTSLSGRGAFITDADLATEYQNRLTLKDSLASWLQTFNWDYFITVTFRYPVPPYRGMHVLNDLYRALSRVIPSPLGRLFLGTEQHVLKNLHVHGLWSSFWRTGPGAEDPPLISAVMIQEMWKICFKRFGRTAISPVKNKEAVAKYCTKYVTKRLTEYNIW